MSKRFSFTVGIIIRIAGSAVSDEQDIISGVEKPLSAEDLPLLWNLRKGVSIPVSGERNLLPLGKLGLPHSLLRPSELKEELLFQDAGNEEICEYFFPHTADPYRKSAEEIYLKRQRLFIESGDEVLLFREGRKAALPLFEIRRVARQKEFNSRIREARRIGRRRETPVLICMVPESEEEAERFAAFLLKARSRYRFQVLELDELLSGSAAVPSRETELQPLRSGNSPLSADPASRFSRTIPWDNPSEGRMFALSRNHHGSQQKGYEEMEEPQRGLIAHMPGEVLMQEGTTSALFRQGELTGLSKTGNPGPISGPCLPSLRTENGVAEVQRIGSFSFQDDPVRGLRDTLILTAEEFSRPLTLTRDYFFVAGDSRLCISFFIRYPRFKTPVAIESCALFEIPLGFGSGDVPARSIIEYPGETSREIRFPDEGDYLLFGTRFFFPTAGGTLCVEFSDFQPMVRELPVSVRENRLFVNPAGSTTPFPGERLDGLQEQFSLIVSIDPAETDKTLTGEKASLLPYLEHHRLFSGSFA